MSIDAQAALARLTVIRDNFTKGGIVVGVDEVHAILAHADAQEAEIERLTVERDDLRRQLDEARAERDAMSNVLPGYYYMDPPDGGDVPLGEQVRRMALDARRYRWLRENLGKWRIETYQTPEQSMIELHVIGDSCFYSGESFDRIIDGLTRPAEES